MLEDFLKTYQTNPFLTDLGNTLKHPNISEASIVLDIIKDAFSKWHEYGIEFTPSKQTVKKTISHIENKKGILVYDKNNMPISTYSYDETKIQLLDNKQFCANLQSGTDTFYKNEKWLDSYLDEASLVFHKFAVLKEYQKTGIGRVIINDFFNRAKKAGYKTIYVETAPQATWLYNWYINLGFYPIGEIHIEDHRNIDSHFLRKEL